MISIFFTFYLNSNDNEILSFAQDEVAEWLRRWTANPLGSARVGSNPILVDDFESWYVYTDVGLGSILRQSQYDCMWLVPSMLLNADRVQLIAPFQNVCCIPILSFMTLMLILRF